MSDKGAIGGTSKAIVNQFESISQQL